MDELAIIITPDGFVTTLAFADLAETGHSAERYMHIRELIDAAESRGATIPHSGGLVVWVDSREASTRRSLNMIGSVTVAKALGSPLPAIYGSVIITGGRAEEPQALSEPQVIAALNHLDLQLTTESVI